MILILILSTLLEMIMILILTLPERMIMILILSTLLEMIMILILTGYAENDSQYHSGSQE
jgi:hypothetical protein